MRASYRDGSESTYISSAVGPVDREKNRGAKTATPTNAKTTAPNTSGLSSGIFRFPYLRSFELVDYGQGPEEAAEFLRTSTLYRESGRETKVRTLRLDGGLGVLSPQSFVQWQIYWVAAIFGRGNPAPAKGLRAGRSATSQPGAVHLRGAGARRRTPREGASRREPAVK